MAPQRNIKKTRSDDNTICIYKLSIHLLLFFFFKQKTAYEIVLNVTASLLENNKANEGGSAVFFVSNNKTGSITIKDSITRFNPRGTFETSGLPGFFVIAQQPAQIVNSQILR